MLTQQLDESINKINKVLVLSQSQFHQHFCNRKIGLKKVKGKRNLVTGNMSVEIKRGHNWFGSLLKFKQKEKQIPNSTLI